MTAVVRLTLVSHAMTDAMAAGRFPTDEPLNTAGHRQVDASIDLGVADVVVAAPEKRTRQTAELLGLQPTIEPLIADLDCGRWRGNALGGVRPAELAVWLTEPTRAPHGGESVVDLVSRVRGWLDSRTTTRSRLIAVTHPSVIRAAILVTLDAPPKSLVAHGPPETQRLRAESCCGFAGTTGRCCRTEPRNRAIALSVARAAARRPA